VVAADNRQDGTFTFHEGKICGSLDLRVYRLTAIQKAAYKFAREFGAVLGPVDGHLLLATFEFQPSMSRDQATLLMRTFFQELLDQELRERIAEETHAIRALILAQAFSKTDLIRRD
jgi:His-Xaa-Ser system protein HxsD